MKRRRVHIINPRGAMTACRKIVMGDMRTTSRPVDVMPSWLCPHCLRHLSALARPVAQEAPGGLFD